MTAALTGRQSAIVLVDDVDAAVLVVNAYAAEHLRFRPPMPRRLPAGSARREPFSSARGPR